MVKDNVIFVSLNISVFVITDTRNERSDKSGKVLEDNIIKSGHKVFEKKFVKDDKELITKELNISLNNSSIGVIILTGGTGLTGRDSTPEAVKELIDKEIPGFGEIFRYISYKKIGTSSLQSEQWLVWQKINLFLFCRVAKCLQRCGKNFEISIGLENKTLQLSRINS